MLWKLLMLSIISFICFAEARLQKFKRNDPEDDHFCADILFFQPSDGMARCTLQCFSSLGCERFFYFPGHKSCMGCSSDGIRASKSVSIGYVRFGPYKYLGCYQAENIDDLIPNVYISFILNITNELCYEHCVVEKGYQYFGTLNDYCFCGNSYNEETTMSEVYCDKTCRGNNAEICGGTRSMSLYVYQ